MRIQEGTTSFRMLRKGDALPEGDERELTDDGGDYPRFKLIPVAFGSSPVTNPVAVLRGFDVRIDRFEPGDDFEGGGRPLGLVDVRVAVDEVTAETVIVRVTFGVRDWSGDWDDPHAATVNFAVIAD